MYTAFVLDDTTRLDLSTQFPPKYPKFIGHHITIDFGVDHIEDDTPANISVVGYSDSSDGLEVLVVSVNGVNKRADGMTYHITWSLDRDKYKPVDSNKLLIGSNWNDVVPIRLGVMVPQLLS